MENSKSQERNKHGTCLGSSWKGWVLSGKVLTSKGDEKQLKFSVWKSKNKSGILGKKIRMQYANEMNARFIRDQQA